MENTRRTDLENQPAPKPGFFRSLRESFGSLGEFIDQIWSKSQNLLETNFELGCEHVNQGELQDAIRRFKVALWLKNDHVPSLYSLGCLYHHMGDERAALDCFVKVLRKEPMNENALYMASTINPEILKVELRPKTVPHAMLVDHFDRLAPYYDQDQQDKRYALPAMLHQALSLEWQDGHSFRDMVDLGCGTGLCAAQFRDNFANIIGVDVSNNMLDEAYKRFDARGVKIYTRLAQQDIRAFLETAPDDSVDVALCIQVFPYIGDVRPVFEQLRRVLRSGGLFACSFDAYHQRHGAGIMASTGYFGHDINYIVNMAQELGYEALRSGEVKAYPDIMKPLCIFKNP